MATENEGFEDMSTEEAVEFMYAQLPPQVQDFLVSPERAAIARELSSKYGLHVDQAGKFERAFMFMLLGVSAPEEFVSSLTAIGLSPETVSGLAADVNTRVFIPLRDAERRASGAPAAQGQSQKPAPLPPPSIDYEPAPPVRTLPGSSEPVPVSLPVPAVVAPVPAPVASALAPAVLEPTPVPAQEIVHAMPAATHQPGWHPAAAVHIFVPTQSTHQPMQPQAAAPIYAPAAPEQPAYIQPSPAFVQEPVLAAPVRTEAAPAKPLVKEYPADPYREPLQ